MDKILPKSETPIGKCNFCDTSIGKLSLCGGCRTVRYCGRGCQKKDRPTHKKACELLSIPSENKSQTPPTKTEKEKFWLSVSSIESHCTEGEPVVISGKKVFDTPAEGRRQMYANCNRISNLTETYFRVVERPKLVLDLGCGRGTNATFPLELGAKVVGIDNSQHALETFKTEFPKKSFKDGQIVLRNEDITKSPDYTINGNKYDVALCIDTLPHLPPASIKATLEKIHRSLNKNGIFIATLFFIPTTGKALLQIFMEKLGAHFCPDITFAKKIITNSNFQILQCVERRDFESEPSACVEVIARKLGE